MEANTSGNILTIAETRTGMAMSRHTGGGLSQELTILDSLQVQNSELSLFLKGQMLGRRVTVKGSTTTMKGTDQEACLVTGHGLHQLHLTV